MSKRMCHQWFSLSHLGLVAGYGALLCGFLASACHAADSAETAMVQVTVKRVGFDPVSRSPVILLLDEAQTRVMPIWIGVAEARAIELELRGQPAARPLTHDLVKTILDQIGVGFDKVVVSELKDSTYYARIHLTTADHPIEIDSRPSDAIALALRFERPIFVAQGLLETALPVDPEQPQSAALSDPQNVRSGGVTVQNISKELARVFRLPGTHGVLVADVETGAAAQGHLQRGDIILTIAGKTIQNILDFQTRMGEEHGQTVSMQIHRDGRAMGIALPTAAP
jgi:bifunctional DNase/RNase